MIQSKNSFTLTTKMTFFLSLLFVSTLNAAGPLACSKLFSGDQETKALTLQTPPTTGQLTSDFQNRAQQIASTTPKLGAYSRISVGLNKENLNIVSDSAAGWMKSSFESVTSKPIEQANQNDIKKYLNAIATENLANLVTPRLHAYRGVDREVLRDSETYYLEELMMSEKHQDLSLALIGQLLFENYAKKDVRLVQSSQTGKPKFALLLNGKSAEVIIPGVCEGNGCGQDFSKITITVTAKPIAAAKDQKQVSIYDMNGQLQTLTVVGRTPLERMIKSDQEQFNNAGPEDLVAVESYFVAQHRPAGSTAFRIGETIFHFGGEGWGVYRGTEKVKGFLISNPYLRHNAQVYASLKVPSFNVGVVMMVPKKHVLLFLAGIDAEMAKPENEKVKFEYYKSNCNHVPLCHFRDAGIPMGNPTGISGFSTSATSRSIFLNPPYPVRSKNIYPLAGTELTESQMRDLFPPLLYRYHTLKHDGHLLNLSQTDIAVWRQATLLMLIQKNPQSTIEQLFELGQKAGLEFTQDQLANGLNQAERENLISNTTQPELTAQGKTQLKEKQKDYDLN
ncbi:MAG: hypothetical protein H7256_01855 [Bdellovibrio sp.]|nr:hypothetical protein [Bdellovibrio sp.]